MAMSSKNSFGAPTISNPNARNSETNDPMRRSFSGNPFAKPSIIANPRSFNPNTPANSPSDFPGRNSLGSRGSTGLFGDLDDKENGEDQNLKAAKIRSPASSLKGTKNFMSPTMSASSKITVSPRKKVLIERNEPARASTSSADGKSPVHKVTLAEPLEGSDLKSGIALEKKKFKALLESGPKPGVRKVTFAVPLEDNDLKPGGGLEEKNLEASFGRFPEEKNLTKPGVRKVTFAVPLEDNDLKPGGGLEEKNLEASFGRFESDTASLISEDLKVEPVFDTQVAFNPRNETELPFETVTQELDCVNLDPTFKLSPTPPPLFSSTSTSLAPLDADPLMPPYDPKTNYLSPRPQFLHYRPKPRLYEDRYPHTLEESYIFGSFSDTEVTEETQSEDSHEESEDVSSVESVEEEDEGRISEPSRTERLVSKDRVEAEEAPKPRFFIRFKAIALLLLLSVACISISITNSLVTDPIMFKELRIFSKIHESSDFFEFAKANFDSLSEFTKANSDGLARNVHIWFNNFMSSISELIANFGGVHDLAHLHYCNLSILHEDVSVYQYPTFSQSEKEVADIPQLNSSLLNDEENGAEIKIDEDIKDFSAEYYSAYEEHFLQDMEVAASVEVVSDASEAEELLESQQLNSSLLTDEENGAEINIDEDIKDFSAEYYSAYEEHFLQDMEVAASVEVVSDALEAEELLESQQLNSSLLTDEDNGAEIKIDEDIKDISAEYYSAYEEHFLQDMEVAASVEVVSDASEVEELLESQQATAIEPSESRQALQQTDVIEPNHCKSNVDVAYQSGSEASKLDVEAFEASNQALEMDTDINAEKVMKIDLKNQPELNSEIDKIHLEVYDDATGNMQPTEAERKSVSVDAASRENEPRLEAIDLPRYMLLYVLLSLSVIATAAFIYSRKYNSRSTNVASCVEQPQFSKALRISVPKKQISLDKPSLWNGPTEMLGESCPSEMSSFQKSSSQIRKEMRESNEAQSIEKKPKKNNRQESLASSDYSLGSPTSYGSFTTYEKIPSKHRRGDENTITPVRRSSRIRNQATSP